jgi:hypothetical protein
VTHVRRKPAGATAGLVAQDNQGPPTELTFGVAVAQIFSRIEAEVLRNLAGRKTAPVAQHPQLQLSGEDKSASLSELALKPPAFVAWLGSLEIDAGALLAKNIVPIAIADLDGTFWKEQINFFVMKLALDKQLLGPKARERLDEVLAVYGLEPSGLDQPDRGVNADVVRAMGAFREWLKTKPSPDEIREMTARGVAMGSWMYAGRTLAEIAALTQEAMEQGGFAQQIFAGAPEIISTLGSKGLPTVLVSSAFEPIVRAACPYLGVPEEQAFGVRPVVDGEGVIQTDVEAPLPFGPGKRELTREILWAYVQEHFPEWSSRVDRDQLRPLFGLGDSPTKTDRELLQDPAVVVVTEPETHADAQHAVDAIGEGRLVLILDYEQTLAGDPADRFAP